MESTLPTITFSGAMRLCQFSGGGSTIELTSITTSFLFIAPVSPRCGRSKIPMQRNWRKSAPSNYRGLPFAHGTIPRLRDELGSPLFFFKLCPLNGLLDVQPNFHKKKWSKHVQKLPGIFKGSQLEKKKRSGSLWENNTIVTGLKRWIMFLTWYKTNRSIAAWKDTKIERTWTYRLVDYHSNGIPISMGNTSTNSGCSWIFRVPCRGCFSKTWPCSQNKSAIPCMFQDQSLGLHA